MKRIAGLFVLLAMSITANAADVWHTAMIKYIYPQADGTVVLTFMTDSPSCPSPNQPKYHYLTVGTNGVTVDGMKNIYATAMLAYSLGIPLNVNFSDTTTNCYINRVYISN